MTKPAPPAASFISQANAARDLDISRVSLWRLISRGLYPQPVALPGLSSRPIPRDEHEAYKARLRAARQHSNDAA